ncbi:MAG TPA: AMP-binding protein [Gammaproteobacteria bacterium]|nr:AMP-binding protein [Gammaproteobacteria bacterium]
MPESQIDPQLSAAAACLTVAGLFRFQARYHGGRVALEDGERCYSYAQLNERVDRLAGALATRGVGRGDRVAVLSENRAEYLELQLACAVLGAVVAALNWRLSPPELEHCIALTRPELLVASPRYRETLAALDHGVPDVLVLGGDYEALLAAGTGAQPDAAAAEDGLIILYTSGTTGMPKGALISHRAMIARAEVSALDHGIDRDDAFVAWAPLFHMASTDAALGTLMRGGRVIVHDGLDTARLVEAVGSTRVGWLVLMPGMVEGFNRAMRETGTRAAGVKTAGCMADLIPRHQIAEATRLLDAPFVDSFGSTETGMAPASAGLIPVGAVPERLSKVQTSFCEIKLVDPDDREVPDGEPGELAIRGPTLFSGYWGAPRVNAEDFRGGWFHMGDVFVRNAEGTLDFVDRRKYLIKSGGENIYPAEIERLLLADQRIADAVVVRKADERWGEIPVAFVVRNDPTLAEADVTAVCEGRLARYKMPREVRFVEHEDLPRSTTGKIKRHEIERRLARRDNR